MNSGEQQIAQDAQPVGQIADDPRASARFSWRSNSAAASNSPLHALFHAHRRALLELQRPYPFYAAGALKGRPLAIGIHR